MFNLTAKQKTIFKYSSFVLVLLVTLVVFYSKPGVTFRVIDTQTKKPIEDAAVVVWWTKTHGLPGLSYRRTSKVVELKTGKDGTFTIPFVIGNKANLVPNIKVYKPGYVGWHNFSIYSGILFNDLTRPHIIKRTSFEYKGQDILLKHWQEGYSHDSHMCFLERGVPIDIKYDEIFLDKVYAYEAPLKIQEANFYRNN